MYSDDVPIIATYGNGSPQGLADVITFALLSARTPLLQVPSQMKEVRERGEKASALWGWKREGYEFLRDGDNTVGLHRMVANNTSTETVLDVLAWAVPGLALVKAGFVAQMLGHKRACCLDSRNLRELDMPARSFREFRRRGGVCVVKPETRARRVAEYLQICEDTGGAEHWWNDWCRREAKDNNRDPDWISHLHVRAIVPRAVRQNVAPSG